MKKIIATVLAMVMALALCTTAFAAVAYTEGYDAKNNGGDGSYSVSDDAATYDRTTGAGKVATKTVAGNLTGTFAVGTKTDYDYVLKADGKSPLYLKNVAAAGAYFGTGTKFTAVGTDCEQLPGDATKTYYSYVNDDDEVEYYVGVKVADASMNLLVDGKLVPVASVDLDLVAHVWKAASYDKDDNAVTYTCKYCGTVATVYDTYGAAEAAGVSTVEELDNGDLIGYTFTAKGTTTTTTTATSPKTFDAGIAMYVGMALTSVAGSAVVIGKKKEF